ncbi:MAG: metallophosphoesterase [Clostridia bacterium]|nr:metallophosphoesterase [Clostridia bacterium]
MREVNHYTVRSTKIEKPLTLAVVADLHNGAYEDLLPQLQGVDAILIVGDLVNRHRSDYAHAVKFLKDAPEIAPTYYAIGNHERRFEQRDAYWPLVLRSRVTVLDNTFTLFEGIVLGALSSAWPGKVKAGFLADMAAQHGYKLLLCHHPEYFEPHVQQHDIDLTLAGHAHGGQVRLFGRGLFAPGQGILPKLTSGWYFDQRLLVSRGLTNSAGAPRFNDPCELILLHLKGENDP